jgi:hypothetical protein
MVTSKRGGKKKVTTGGSVKGGSIQPRLNK